MKEKKTHILRTTLVAFFGLAVTIVLFFIGSVSIQGLGLCNVESEYMIATNDLGNMFDWFQNLTSGNVFLSTWIFLGLFILAIIGIIFAIIVMIKKRSGKGCCVERDRAFFCSRHPVLDYDRNGSSVVSERLWVSGDADDFHCGFSVVD